jgi:acetone carboxylase beta subunit
LRSRQALCYVDVGGTFTDAFVVDEDGGFAVAKAPTVPSEIARGFVDAVDAAAKQLQMPLAELLGELRVVGFGSTTVLNAIVTRSGGGNPGLLITKGLESLLTMQRGKQTWVTLPRAARIHPVMHRREAPLVPLHLTHGITERIDSTGEVLIPLYEDDIDRAVRALVEDGADAIVIVFLWSFLNDSHERAAAEIAARTLDELGVRLPIVLSSDICPTLRELPRANGTVVEAYAGPSTLEALRTLEGSLQTKGFGGELQVMQSAGGLAPAREVRAIDTVKSGPVGGLIGARFIGELYGFDSIISTDVGGTTFDVGLISGGFIGVDREPVVGGLLLSVPMMEVTSIGAGGGTLAWIDPLSERLTVGPESAGADPGPVCYQQGGEVPTVTDADVVLGYLDPDLFNGGRVSISVEAARSAIEKSIADPLGISVEEAAEGIRSIIDTRMREAVVGLVATRGYSLERYHLLAFGGAGPSHVAGYTEGLPLAGVLSFPYSSVFSAFGAAAADYEHHYSRSVNVVLPAGASDDVAREMGERINETWRALETQAYQQLAREGFTADDVEFRHQAMVRYGRQLNDLVVTSPVTRIASAAAMGGLVRAFEELYSTVFALGARYPEAGYEIFEVGVVATAAKVKPQIASYSLSGEDPSQAERGRRRAYFGGTWHDTPQYEMGRLASGNLVRGPALVADPTTTLVVPPGLTARVDEYRTIWLTNE